MSSESALILKLSPLAMAVLGNVPNATASVLRYSDQCVTVPTASSAVPKSMSPVMLMSPFEAAEMFPVGTLTPFS